MDGNRMYFFGGVLLIIYSILLPLIQFGIIFPANPDPLPWWGIFLFEAIMLYCAVMFFKLSCDSEK